MTDIEAEIFTLFRHLNPLDKRVVAELVVHMAESQGELTFDDIDRWFKARRAELVATLH